MWLTKFYVDINLFSTHKQHCICQINAANEMILLRMWNMDLCSALYKNTVNVLNVLVPWEQPCLYRPGARPVVSSRQTGRRQRKPSSMCARSVTWNDMLMTAGQTIDAVEQRHETLVRQVARSFSVLTSVGYNAELVTDPLWDVKPVQLRMTDCGQATVKFPLLLTTRAAALRTRCSLLIVVFGASVNMTLQ